MNVAQCQIMRARDVFMKPVRMWKQFPLLADMSHLIAIVGVQSQPRWIVSVVVYGWLASSFVVLLKMERKKEERTSYSTYDADSMWLPYTLYGLFMWL